MPIKSILNNNSLLITIPLNQSNSLTSMALVKAGPRFDPPGKEGLSHFVEHMLFKGTRRWPTSNELAVSLERNGAFTYAFTYYENSTYWIRSGNENLDLSIEQLVDRLFYSLIKEEDIETEKKSGFGGDENLSKQPKYVYLGCLVGNSLEIPKTW